MSAVAAGQPADSRRMQQALVSQAATRFFATFFAWLLPFFLIFGTSLTQKIPLQIHPIVFISFGIVIWAWTVRGPMAIARTPVDNFFLLWIVLAVASQIWAETGLYRTLDERDFTEYIKQIITGWVIFRAAYGIGAVEPKVGTNAFLRSIVFFAGAACVLGLLQSKGPLQQTALDFAQRFGWNPEQVLIGATIESPRPVGMFSGPNFFAFINLIASAIIVGITLGTGKRMKEVHTFIATAALGLFFAGSFVAQSRIALVMHGLLIIIFLYLLLKSGKGRAFLFAVVSMALTGLAMVAVKSDLDLKYLTSVFETGLKNDESYLLRTEAIDAISDLAPDLALLGAGGNRFSLILIRTGDKFSAGNGPDNAFLQGFLDHGVPGVLHIIYLLWGLYWGIRLLKTHGEPYLERTRYVGILVLFFLVLYSVSASRHQKPETGAFIWFIFGPVWAMVKIQESHAKFLEKGGRVIVRRRRLRRRTKAALPAESPAS
ncbi:MAG: hypothetical protein U0S12_09970 [Fimbriimonadales bacterium]